MYIIHQKVAHAFRVLTALKQMKYNLMLQTWNLLVYVARLRKKNIILWRTLTKIVEKIKLTKLKYLITAWLHSNSPLQRKLARRKLVFTVAVSLKGNRSSFSKQLGINCTCEQIGLFSNFHSWLRQPLVEILKKSDLFTRTINP